MTEPFDLIEARCFVSGTKEDGFLKGQPTSDFSVS
jgi:hypothetical protein